MSNGFRSLLFYIVLLSVSGPAFAQQVLKFIGQPQESRECFYQENAPTSIEVTLLFQAGSSTGLIEFRWPKSDKKGPESIVALIDVMTRNPETLDGASLLLAETPSYRQSGLQIYFSTRIDLSSKAYKVSEVQHRSGARKWRCLDLPLSLVATETWTDADIKRFAALAAGVRTGDVVAAQNDGPSEPEVRDQMTRAAAYNLCNPTDPEMAAQIQAFNASGLGAYKVEGDACVAYMMGFPVGIMRFNHQSWSCDVNSTSKIAACVSEMTLRCEAPTDVTGLSASYCSSVLSANFIFSGEADFTFNSKSGSWVAGPISIAGKER